MDVGTGIGAWWHRGLAPPITPVSLPRPALLPGLADAVTRTPVGWRARVFLPASRAYGARLAPGADPEHPLEATAFTVDFEVLQILK